MLSVKGPVLNHIVLWKWRGKPNVDRSYTAEHVNAMVRGIRANTLGLRIRIVCVTDDPEGIIVGANKCDVYPLWPDCGELANATKPNLPSCYRRLKLYDPETQRDMGIEEGDRIVSIDIDTLVTGDLRQVLATPGLYVGWQLAGDIHPDVYNGSFQMFTAGTLADIWRDFDPSRSPLETRRNGWMGSDQAWLSSKLIGREGCTHIPYPVLASYPLHCRRLGSFSAKTRLVMFHGRMKPWDEAEQQRSPWIKRYWRPDHVLSE